MISCKFRREYETLYRFAAMHPDKKTFCSQIRSSVRFELANARIQQLSDLIWRNTADLQSANKKIIWKMWWFEIRKIINNS